MEREQAKSIFKDVAAFFPGWKVDKGIAESWINVLVKEDYETVTANVEDYIKSGNEYPPSIPALIKINSRIEAQRDKERTMKMLREMEEHSKSIPKDPPWVREGLNKEEWMRKVVERERKAQ